MPWNLSPRRIHFDKDVDCGRQGEDVEDQTTCEQGPRTEEESVYCGAGERRRRQGLAGGERNFAC